MLLDWQAYGCVYILDVMKAQIFFIVCLLFISCSNAEVNNSYVDMDNPEKVSIWNYVDSVNVIQLQTSPECLLSGVNKVLFYKDMIFIFDMLQKKVCRFDASGNFICQIGRYGRGPEEHLYFEDFCIDKFNDEVIILEPWGKMVCYDLDGSFRRKIDLPNSITAYNKLYAVNRDTMLFMSVGGDCQVAAYSKSMDSVVNMMYPGRPPVIMINVNNTYEYGDSVFFYKSFENDIENISRLREDQIVYSWNFGKYNSQNNLLDEFRNHLVENEKVFLKRRMNFEDITNSFNGINYCVRRVVESDRYRFAMVFFKDAYYNIIQDKITKKDVFFQNTIEGINFSDMYISDNMLFVFNNIAPIDDLLTGKNRQIVENHNSEEDNPYLVVYYLKR